MFDEFISHGKLFYRGHKTCNFFNAIFHKKRFLKEREKILVLLFALVSVELHQLGLGPGVHRSNKALYVTQGATGYGLRDGSIIYILPRWGINFEIVYHKQKEPWSEFGSLWDWAPLRETVGRQFYTLLPVYQEIGHPGFDAVRHVKTIDLCNEDLCLSIAK